MNAQDLTTLEGFVAWIISGGGAAWLSYWIMANWLLMATLSPRAKRFASLALAAALAMAGQGLAVVIGLNAIPLGGLAWVRLLFSAAAIAVIGAQAYHGQAKLPTESWEVVEYKKRLANNPPRVGR
jgi:hypothetical protein